MKVVRGSGCWEGEWRLEGCQSRMEVGRGGWEGDNGRRLGVGGGWEGDNGRLGVGGRLGG